MPASHRSRWKGGSGSPAIVGECEQLFLVGIDREGTYDLVIEADGYETWRRDDVRVRRERHCSVLRQVQLTARLERR